MPKIYYFAGMKRTTYFFLFLFFLPIVIGTACKSKVKQTTAESENNIDAARNFIRAALDGKFDKARTYMLEDSVNTNYMDVAERSYQKADQATKDGYRVASIKIIKLNEPVPDSITVVIFSNSFKNDHDTLKVLKQNNQWLVDLKYLYEHDGDTLQNKLITNDTMK